MSMGIPSIGTDVVGIKDLILHGKTGYLAKEGDSQGLADIVIKLLDSPEMLSVFSENAKTITRANFNFNDGIKEYEEFYTSQCLQTA
jgi:glycosyltransferase involved in cell wall biosynthesis